MSATCRRAVVLSLLISVALAAAPVAGQDREVSQACVSSYERTGELRAIFRDAMRARAEATRCASVCPPELADECKQWAVEEQAKIAAVELVSPLPFEKLSIRLDGEQKGGPKLELNAGKHELAVSAAGFEPLSLAFELAEGEQRRLDLRLRPIASPPRPRAAPAPDPPVAGYTLLGIGLAGMAAGGALAIVGHVQASDLRESCAPFCTDEEVAVVEREWIAGGITAGAGLAALTTGALLLLLPAAGPDVSVQASLGGSGAKGALSWHF